MPPEPLPWDRRDFRKHERSGGSDPRFGGGFRWRDLPHPLHPPPPHPYHHHRHQRWFSDFRSRPPPPGHGKQGGWHMYPEESGHGFPPFGSRFNDRNLDEENSRPFVSRGEGRCFRNSRENRGSFNQKDWKGNSWERPASPSGLDKLNNEINDHRSVGNTQTCNNNRNHHNHNKNNSHPDPNLANLWDQSQSQSQSRIKNDDNADGLDSSGQKLELENSLGSIDWKPLKWTRSESLSSRGSGSSNSSSSKSMGADSNEMKSEMQPEKVMPVQSPSEVAVACVTSIVSTPASEETSSRKKPRLGWGEGLAKYEKKNGDEPEDGVTENGLVISVNNTEPIHASSVDLADKSPTLVGLSDYASPATPSSVACSSSPGIEEKQSNKAANADHDASNLSFSPSIASCIPCQGPTFNLENLEPTSIANLSSYIIEVLQSDDPCSVGNDFLRSTALKKLLVWKVDILKALEMTESEIDLLETELKSSTSDSRIECPQPAVSSSLPREGHSKTCEELVATSSLIPRPAPLQFASSGINIMESTPIALETELKDEDIDSPGSATSKFIEVPSSGEDVSPPEATKNIDSFLNSDVNNSKANTDGMPANDSQPGASSSCSTLTTDYDLHCNGEDIYNLILVSNKESADRASEVLNKLLPVNQYQSSISHLQSDPMTIKKKFLMRKRFVQFKEKVFTLKFRAFKRFWKDDRLIALIKVLIKSQKKLDRSLRTTRQSHQKHCSSTIEFSYPDGIFNVVPEAEVSDFVSRLLSDSPVKLCRNMLNMPALILDEKEKVLSKFISNNGLVEDPFAIEKERSMINPWTSAERDIFIDKLATFGKDFRKIASFLEHKTTADCIEFYYKNHKSDFFEKAKKRPDFAKPSKPRSTNTYLVASGKRWNHEANAASLNVLGVSSASAGNVGDSIEIHQKCTSKYFYGVTSAPKTARIDVVSLERRASLDIYNNDRETVAADVLAGICGSLSSEAMSSCTTSAVDHGECYKDWRYQRAGSSLRQPLTPEDTRDVDSECSDDSCGEMMDNTAWTDEEKSIFIQAVSSYGNDFAMISRYVRTKSRDQCKVFFSKARKCLGLDLIHPSLGNVVPGEVNDAGSDMDDACVVDIGSVICSEKSRSKVDEYLQSPDMKLSNESDVGTLNMKPNHTKNENNNGIGSHDSIGTEPFPNKLTPNDCQVDDKPDLGLDAGDDESNCANGQSAAAGDHGNSVVPFDKEAGRVIEEADDLTLPNRSSCEAENTASLGVPNGHPRAGNEGSLNDEKLENVHGTSGKVSGISCSIIEMKYEPQLAANPSRPSSDVHSSQVNILSRCQKKADFESCSAEKAHTVTLQQIDCLAPTILFPQTAPVKDKKISTICDHGINDEQCQTIVWAENYDHFLSGHSLLDHTDSSQIISHHPSSPKTMKEMNDDMNCKRSILLQSAPKSDGNAHPDRQVEFNLQKCNRLRNHSSVAEASLPSQDQTKDLSRPQSGSSSNVGKPCRNGDVKLFGKILISSEQKPSSIHQRDDNKTQHHKSGSKSFNLKFGGDRSANLDLDQAIFEHNSYLGSENTPVRNFGFWDENRMRIVFPPLLESTLLLTKYPTAFSNCAMPSAKLEQPPLHGVVRSNKHSLNGVSIFQTREPSSRNGPADYQMVTNEEVQPLNVEMKRQQALFAEMQRRNGFDVVSGMQQQPRGVVGINVVGRGGVLVGGQPTGISDPVAVIKMHYAKAEQFGAQSGNIILEDDTWRSKGDVGR